MQTTTKAKISFTLKRFVNFLKNFRHSKRGLIGAGILILYSAIAIAAPLLSPYDPVWDFYISGNYAVPLWFKQLPGGQDLSENLQIVTQPGFTTSASLDEWNFTKTTSSANVELRWDHVMGEGAAAIDFTRKAGNGYAGQVKANLSREFFYPFGSPPTRFKCDIAVFIEGASSLERTDIKVFLNRIGQNGTSFYPLWMKTFYKETTTWILPDPELDSFASKEWVQQYFGNRMLDPAKEVFNETTYYDYVVEVDFVDSKLGTLNKDVTATVYIDNLNVRLFGNAFGLLGTDHKGRDIFSQLVQGSRLSLLVGLLSAVVSVILGLIFGLVSGYLGKIIDEIIMRFTDMLLVLPTLPLLLVLIAVIGPGIMNLIIIIGVLGWMGFARVVRSQVLTIKERPFVEAAKAVGAGRIHIITRHILPNVMSLVYVSLALSVPTAILSESALSWLGLFDPNTMSWGRMLFDVQNHHGVERWWWVIPPGLSIALVSLSFVLIGYALDEILNPKLRLRR